MKPYLEILMNNWEFLAPVIYEIIARLWPTRWNISILDNGWKILNWIVPNLRKKKGNEMMANDRQNLIPVNVNKHVLKCLLVLFLSAPLIQANAQIWQNFKGIRLVNESDTAQQLSVQGSLFYDDVIDSLYLYNGTKWVNLMRTGGGSGGAFWPLGGTGTLTAPVTINGVSTTLTLSTYDGFDGTQTLTFEPSASFVSLAARSQSAPAATGSIEVGNIFGGAYVNIAATDDGVTFSNVSAEIGLAKIAYGASNVSVNTNGVVLTSAPGLDIELDGNVQLSPDNSSSHLYSGTYVPIGTASTNVTSITPDQAIYSRVGSVVTVSGSFSWTINGTGSTRAELTLPIASNFATLDDANGSGHGVDGSGGSIAIQANATNDRILISQSGPGAGTFGDIRYVYTYIIR